MEAHDQPISEVYEVLSKLLLGAHESVLQSSGLTTDGLLRLKPVVEKCLARVGSYRLIIDGEAAATKFKSKDYDWLRNNPKVSSRVSPEPVNHWIIVDGRNMRLENPHSEGDATLRQNVVIVDAEPDIAERARAIFEGWWSLSVDIQTWQPTTTESID